MSEGGDQVTVMDPNRDRKWSLGKEVNFVLADRFRFKVCFVHQVVKKRADKLFVFTESHDQIAVARLVVDVLEREHAGLG